MIAHPSSTDGADGWQSVEALFGDFAEVCLHEARGEEEEKGGGSLKKKKKQPSTLSFGCRSLGSSPCRRDWSGGGHPQIPGGCPQPCRPLGARLSLRAPVITLPAFPFPCLPRIARGSGRELQASLSTSGHRQDGDSGDTGTAGRCGEEY